MQNNRDTELTQIPGMKYIPDYITEDEHDNLLEMIDRQTWLEDLKRRVQHYGYKYDYKKRSVNPSMYLGELPEWLLSIARRLYDNRILGKIPDQVIINEYQPGQGIADHVDCPRCFENTIISLSLGSTCIMQFSHVTTPEKIPILLYPRSLIVLQGQARYQWKHGIPARKIDKYGCREFVRTRRVSMTFRNISQPQNTSIRQLFQPK
ncbi:alpha-ketoglutarate-dependent dioxygenase AlkB [Microseira sp. BLCC-F43]|jgi:alkylated DNA repair dioxygenase AlkB|uniref:alpha-ketoglutarate-dependent dioxygenase AlkB n=1 Tax=Microseira sp. BLCC-F43 TaxID=3153602 RepID=UPI0035BAD388